MGKAGKFLTGLALLASLAGSVRDSGATSVAVEYPELVNHTELAYPLDIKEELSDMKLEGTITYDVFLKQGEGDTLLVDHYELSNIEASKYCDMYFSQIFPCQEAINNAVESGNLESLVNGIEYTAHVPEEADSIVSKAYVDSVQSEWSEYLGEVGLPEFIENSGYLDSLKFTGPYQESESVSFDVNGPYDSLMGY
jgi:hypothetical protein